MKSIKVIIISISITTFLLTHLPLSISYANREIAALGNLKGVYVNLKIHYRSLQGMTRHSINQDILLKHFKNELIEKCKTERNKILFRIVDPHLNVNITIKGDRQKNRYYITTDASLKQGISEWYIQTNDYWDKQKNLAPVRKAERAVEYIEKELKDDQLSYQEIMIVDSIRRYFKDEVKEDKKALAAAKKQLAEAKKKLSLLYTIKQTLTNVASAFVADYTLAKKLEKEYKKKERETTVLTSQLEHEEEATPSGPEENYIEYGSRSRLNILYEVGNMIKLYNPSDTTVAIYKDENLSNLTNLFANGIGATVIEFKTFPDKPIAYKVQILLKDGSKYTGWVPGNVIRP